MNAAVVLVIIGVVSCAFALPNVVNFEIEEEEKFVENVEDDLKEDVLSLFRTPEEKATKKPVGVNSFKWRNCGSASTVATIKALALTPDPIATPGDLFVTLSAMVGADVGGKLVANVTIEKMVAGSYIKLPCIANFGSCVYHDLCSLLDNINCPEAVVEAGLNCRCPIKKRAYTFQKAELNIPVSFPLPGTFRLTGDVTMTSESPKKSKPIVCLQIEVTFE